MSSEEVKEREAVKKAYPNSINWHNKVDAMSTSQVTAIYLKFKAEGRLG